MTTGRKWKMAKKKASKLLIRAINKKKYFSTFFPFKLQEYRGNI